jgi:hypothetical protein
MPDVACLLCGGSVEVGPVHVSVHGVGEVCWACARERDPDDWGLDQFEALVARVLETRDRPADESPSALAE